MTQVAGSRQGDYHQAIERLFNEGSVSGLSEVQLLERFAARRDEAAFAALVERHGPMVLGVCRRFLRDPNDVDDAFQAVFLVLVRKAGGLRQKDLLGNWLYGVACRVAVRARSTVAQRRAKAGPTGNAERLAVDRRRPLDEEPWESLNRDEGRSWLHEEVERLPRRYRQPVVACYFEGRTHEEAATLLNCPLGTVKGRLSRARDLLRKRLERRGLAVPAVALAAQLASPDLRAAVPVPLASATVRSGLALATAGASLMTTSAISTSVRTLTEGVLHAMVVTHVKAVALPMTLVAAGVLAAGAGVIARQDAAGKSAAESTVVTVQTPTKVRVSQTSQPEAATNPSTEFEKTVLAMFKRLETLGHQYETLKGQFMVDLGGRKGDDAKNRAEAVHRDRVEAMLRSIEGEAPTSDADRELNAAFRNYVEKNVDKDFKELAQQQDAGAMRMLHADNFGNLAPGYQESIQRLHDDLASLKAPEEMAAAWILHRGRLASLARSAGPNGQPLRDLYDASLAIAAKTDPEPKAPPAVAQADAEGPKATPTSTKAVAVGELGGGFGGGGGGANDGLPTDESYRLQIARVSAALSTLDKSPMNQAVLKALENPISLRSTEKTTLGQMLKQIKDSVKTADGKKIPIYVDPVALQEAEKTLDVPVVIDLEDVPLKFSLRLMLKQLGLAYCIRDGVLIISSLEGVQQELMEAQSEQMGLNPKAFPMMGGGMGGMGGGFGGMGGGMGGGQGMM
ncbi:MAG: sigma-70 family RNA polymerase sigma factor [Paludisphaera borealis]|uniref:RNA polymerase sigma factor n=1 Tax=Paludisphaera borealis TaxID=1387353 RepID=UPI0028409E72|nr:sigma-70 family RNA polymerase sigma factor [Paludisphaera borealis]MDR3621304.1 sigma-70 family RNA polymerase sigma factor [Paludisphaera borealis]